MDIALLVMFLAGFYAVIGFMSMAAFREWCGILFNRNWELGNATGTLAAVIWPLSWPAMAVVGLYHLVLIALSSTMNAAHTIGKSFKVVRNHFMGSDGKSNK